MRNVTLRSCCFVFPKSERSHFSPYSINFRISQNKGFEGFLPIRFSIRGRLQRCIYSVFVFVFAFVKTRAFHISYPMTTIAALHKIAYFQFFYSFVFVSIKTATLQLFCLLFPNLCLLEKELLQRTAPSFQLGVDLLCPPTLVPSFFVYPFTGTIFLFCTPLVLDFVFAISLSYLSKKAETLQLVKAPLCVNQLPFTGSGPGPIQILKALLP